MKKKRYLKIGLLNLLFGLVLVMYSSSGNSASADVISVPGDGLAVMKYIYGIGMGLVAIAILMFALLSTGKQQ